MGRAVDVVVREDRVFNRPSGLCWFMHNTNKIMGMDWWKYVGLSQRIQNSYVVFGGDFSPQRLGVLYRIAQSATKVFLAG